MAKPKCTPLEIRCTLQDGMFVSSDGIIMLDSILYHAWFAKHKPHVLLGEPGSHPDGGYIGLPLRQEPGNRWAASMGVAKTAHTQVFSINKYPDFFDPRCTDLLALEKGTISSGTGPYRAWRIPLLGRTVEGGVLTFFALGHRDEVEELLSYIPAIGKKNAAGYGAVKRWDVLDLDPDDPAAWTLYREIDGRIVRPVPVEEVEEPIPGAPVQMYGVRPPYWKPGNATLCYVPVPG